MTAVRFRAANVRKCETSSTSSRPAPPPRTVLGILILCFMLLYTLFQSLCPIFGPEKTEKEAEKEPEKEAEEVAEKDLSKHLVYKSLPVIQ